MAFVMRFFRVVRVTHPLTTAAFGVALAVAALVFMTDDVPVSGALAPVLVLQALATSSGFAGPARRGQYDLLFMTGRSRVRIGLMHWLMSAMPGAVSWLSVAALELAVRPDTPALSLASGTFAGMFLVSTLPWAATVALPRLTGGIAWILLVVIALTLTPESGRNVSAAGLLLFPWGLVGRQVSGGDMVPVGIAVAVAFAAMAGALVWIDRTDVPLETAQ